MTKSFLDLLNKLVKEGVDFVVVGGFAGVAHGCTYVTQDIDICCDFSADNLLRLQKAVKNLHPVHRMTPKRKKLHLTESACTNLKNLYLDTDIARLDCLSFIDGLGDFSRVKKNSVLIEVDGLKIRILSLDGLLESKKAMNRPRDKETILQLQAIKKLKTKKT